MPGEEVHQRKGGGRSKKSRSKAKGRQSGTACMDGQDVSQCPSPQVALGLLQRKTMEEKARTAVAKVDEESSIAICLQVLFPYLLAGMGMVMAGMVLDSVQVIDTVV